MITDKKVRKSLNHSGLLHKWQNWGDVDWETYGGLFVQWDSKYDTVRVVEFRNMGEYDAAWEGQCNITETGINPDMIADAINEKRGILDFVGTPKSATLAQKIFRAIDGWNAYYGSDANLFDGTVEDGVEYLKEYIEGLKKIL